MRRGVLALATPLILLVANAGGVSAAPPNNDHFGDARTVGALPYTNAVDTTDATDSGPDPECTGGETHTVWYRFTPSVDGSIRVAVDADFDATVSVYTGTGDDLDPVACADDPPSLAFGARSGTTYHIMVSSCCGGEGGTATLTVARIVRPTVDVRLDGGIANTRSGDATVRGVVTCGHARTASIGVQVRQRTRTGLIVVGSAFASAACDGAAHRWRTLVLSDREFRPGWARVMVSAQACGRGVCATEEVTRVIWLSRRPLP